MREGAGHARERKNERQAGSQRWWPGTAEPPPIQPA